MLELPYFSQRDSLPRVTFLQLHKKYGMMKVFCDSLECLSSHLGSSAQLGFIRTHEHTNGQANTTSVFPISEPQNPWIDEVYDFTNPVRWIWKLLSCKRARRAPTRWTTTPSGKMQFLWKFPKRHILLTLSSHLIPDVLTSIDLRTRKNRKMAKTSHVRTIVDQGFEIDTSTTSFWGILMPPCCWPFSNCLTILVKWFWQW